MVAPIDEAVLKELLDSGLDDWVALVEVGFAVRRILGVRDEDVCDEMRRIVTVLVQEDLFRPGTYHGEDELRPLGQPLADILDDVCARWVGVDDSDWWEVLWLDLTQRGEEEARRFFPKRFEGDEPQDGESG